jgi:hypothetical protein
LLFSRDFSFEKSGKAFLKKANARLSFFERSDYASRVKIAFTFSVIIVSSTPWWTSRSLK